MNRVYGYVPCAPSFPWRHRGLHRDLLKGRDHTVLRKIMVDRWGPPAGIEVGVCYSHPWGRTLPPIRTNDGQWTTMKSTALRSAQTSPDWCWLVDSFDKELERMGNRHTAIYTGGNPSLFPNYLGFQDLPVEYSRLALDATAKLPHTASILVNPETIVEGNARRDDARPCIARWDLWGKRGRYRITEAPEGSLVWFPAGIRVYEVWEAFKAACQYGVESVVNLARTDTARLWATMKEYG